MTASIEHMGVDLGCTDITMAKQLLNRPDIVAGFQQMCCKAVTQGMAGRRL